MDLKTVIRFPITTGTNVGRAGSFLPAPPGVERGAVKTYDGFHTIINSAGCFGELGQG
jgi:hypothetical protein